MKKNRIVKFGLLILGFIFFANPNISVFDILPDCIGCLFIIAAIFKLSDMSDEMAEARRAFHILFWINLSKLPALMLLLWTTGVNVGEETMWLLFAFCYAVAETVFGLRAFRALFDGLAYFGTRKDGGEFILVKLLRAEKTAKNGKITPAKYRRIESYLGFTSLFWVAKQVLCTLPEFALLSSHDSLGYVTSEGLMIYNFRPVFLALGAIVSLVFGIVWLVRICGYTRHLARHKDFFSTLCEEYKDVVNNRKGIFAMRRTHIFSVVASAAAIFSVDFYLDEVNVLPDFISAVLLFIAASIIANQVGGAKWLKISSVLYFLTSLVTFVSMLAFTSEYPYSEVHKIEHAKELYLPYAVSNAVTQIAFLLAFCALAGVVMKVVRAHTGINTVTGVSNSSKPLVTVYKGRAIRLGIVTFLAAVMSTLYFYFVVDVKSVQLRDDGFGSGGYLYFPKFEIVWMVDFAVAVIFAVFTCNLLYDLVNEVRYKYRYE